MKIHHLNCATMRPPLGRLLGARAPGRDHHEMICHCLLIEHAHGLVLVDSGLGLEDIRDPRPLGGAFRKIVRPVLDEHETAVRQVASLGFDPRDVRHIVLTHLDVDHAGGLPDFPWAAVHVMADEWRAATTRAHRLEKKRYIPRHWAHEPTVHGHEPTDGERWNGFECVRGLTGLPPEILLVPVPGHTRGHAAVAVDRGDGWLLHAGDAYFHHREMAEPAHCPPGLRLFQRVVQMDGPQRLANRDRLRELALDQAGNVEVFCAHDPVELDRMVATALGPQGGVGHLA